jgi:hypothetical protein
MRRSTPAAPGSNVGGSLGHLTVISATAKAEDAHPGLSAGEPGTRSGVTLFMPVPLSLLKRLDR